MMKEKDCIARILAGDTEQYRELVDRYQTGLIIHCGNIVRSREEGEDIAQEVFIKAFKNLQAAQYYNNQKVEPGSSIIVKCVEEATAHVTDISAAYMYFQIELVSKGDAIKAY